MIQYSKELLDKFGGSWVKVTVEFYDFIMSHGFPAHVECLSKKMKEELFDSFAKGESLYKEMVRRAENKWNSLEEAFDDFLKHV